MSTKLCRIARMRKAPEGAAAVEFAVILPIFLLLMLGIIDFGNLFYQMHAVNEAARAAARYATTHQNLAGISTDVTNFVQTNYGDQFQVSVSPPVSKGNITVTVTTTVTISTPIISSFFPSNPYTVTGRCVMGLEN